MYAYPYPTTGKPGVRGSRQECFSGLLNRYTETLNTWESGVQWIHSLGSL